MFANVLCLYLSAVSGSHNFMNTNDYNSTVPPTPNSNAQNTDGSHPQHVVVQKYIREYNII